MRLVPSSLARTVVLVAALLAVATSSTGCRSLVEACGYTVVDDELKQIVVVRDDATQEYIKATLPLIDEHAPESDKLRWSDLGRTLARVSKKERELIER